jgi:hypothetical protein
MNNRPSSPPQSIKERAEELVQSILDALESLVSPPPALVPVPIRGARRPIRR